MDQLLLRKGFIVTLVAILVVSVYSSPEITSYTKVVTLKETTAINTELSDIVCTDSDGDSTRTLVKQIDPGSPCGNCFRITSTGANAKLEYRAGVGTLDHGSAGSYLVTVTCTDNKETPYTEVIMVIIIPNSPPVFASLVEDVTVDASIGAGDEVGKFPATDDDNDALSYSLTVLPSSAQIAFAIDTSGTVTALQDLRTLCRSFVTLQVSVSDGRSTVGPKVINVSFTKNRVAPIAINLNTEIHIPEGTTGKIYEYAFISDEDLTYTVTSTNAAGFAQFEADKAVLNVVADLNYEVESLRITDLVIKATDGYCESDTYSLRIKVTDVNEAPVISDHRTSISICEGRTEFEPPFTWSDEDEYDVHKWSLFSDDEGGIFYVHPETGFLGTNLEYDVDPDYDKPKKYAARYRYKFEVIDKGGLTATATVSATFLDCNDNAPRFTKPFFTFTANECTASGSTLGRLLAIDADSDREGNNVITFSGAAGAVEVGATGAVILRNPLPAGTVHVFDAWATDQGLTPGRLVSEQPAKVSVVFGVCPAPASSDSDSGNESNSNARANLVWIVITGILGAVLAGLLLYMLWKYSRVMGDVCCKARGCGDSCRKSSQSRWQTRSRETSNNRWTM